MKRKVTNYARVTPRAAPERVIFFDDTSAMLVDAMLASLAAEASAGTHVALYRKPKAMMGRCPLPVIVGAR